MPPRRLLPVLLAALLTAAACGPSEPDRGAPFSTEPAEDAATAAREQAVEPADREPPPPPVDPSTPLEHRGIDVSHHQGPVDWEAVRADGIAFAFAKATEGHETIDPLFADNWRGMREAGLVRGAYHFFEPDVDAAAQAEHFLSIVPRLEPGDLPPALDVEEALGEGADQLDTDVQLWLDRVEEALGIRPLLYSGLNFSQQYLARGGFGDYPLWLAYYSEAPPDTLDAWDSWTFWQYSQTGQIKGVEKPVDQSRFQGTVGSWKELLYHGEDAPEL